MRRRKREAAREPGANREKHGVRGSCFRSTIRPPPRSPVARLKRTLKSHFSPLPSCTAPWLFRFIVRDTICIAITMPTPVGTNLPFRHLSNRFPLDRRGGWSNARPLLTLSKHPVPSCFSTASANFLG